MCGVFGFVANGSEGPDLRTLERIATATETRGPHAFGLAWIDSRGRLRMFKESGRITSRLGILEMALDAQVLIGHCRWATHGDPRNNLNNHPHPVDGGWLVHNGVIHAHREIVDDYCLSPVTQCDSEVLGLLVEQLDGTLTERCIRAAQIAGDGPLAMLALWRSPRRMIAIRQGNPLYLTETARGTYLASQRQGLPDGAYSLRDDTALSFTIQHDRTKMIAFDAAEVVLQ